VKVCGMREPENIREIATLDINWIGLIFYARSPRAINNSDWTTSHTTLLEETLSLLPGLPVKKVGVFVNATEEQVQEAAARYQLDYIQLHGNESPGFCHTLQKRGYRIIKVFSIASAADLANTGAYEGYADYFLFDTKCSGYGGSGKCFDWSVLTGYTGETPFLLSGGINPESAAAICSFEHPRFAGIDLNSGFETAPGKKDAASLSLFLEQLKNKKI
ncbi:MAG: phosphoribosylanthranilate isomerase, partial [Tannerellaceae bacterium]|nr:phosphoribosylanthranilate isomerase [Tannerellaceae bacterium]